MSHTPTAVYPSSREAPHYQAFTAKHLDELTARAGLPESERLAVRAVATVLPFRTNSYVTDQLIDWSSAPEDPIYRLVFPQPDMLPEQDLSRLTRLLRDDSPNAAIQRAAHEIRMRLNPHPAGQMNLNAVTLDSAPVPGLQHKYAETLLLFPQQGQTCHAYCSYCFRWAQFVGEPTLKMATSETERFAAYIEKNPQITSVLITGGDPMIMSAAVAARYIEPLLAPGMEHVESIRIGTKALSYWPYRFTSDPDADGILRLFERVVQSGRNLAVMAHFTHPREMDPDVVREAVRRVQSTGAIIRTQAPLIRLVNDAPLTWAEMWRKQVSQGMVPYYMFVERDTGPQDYFSVPLDRAYGIFRDAYAQVSGLARTVRGPSMSMTDGKICIDGIAEVAGKRVFVLHLIQCRDPGLVGCPFFARYDTRARWVSDLRPAFADKFPFEEAHPYAG
jgi:KamA family protein